MSTTKIFGGVKDEDTKPCILLMRNSLELPVMEWDTVIMD